MVDWQWAEFGSLYLEPSRNGLTKPKRVRGQGHKFVNVPATATHQKKRQYEEKSTHSCHLQTISIRTSMARCMTSRRRKSDDIGTNWKANCCPRHFERGVQLLVHWNSAKETRRQRIGLIRMAAMGQ